MATSAPPTQKHGCRYTTVDDEAVARAYMAECTYPILGSNQTNGTFYEGICDKYKENKPSDCAVRP